jgi:hypothetical protein
MGSVGLQQQQHDLQAALLRLKSSLVLDQSSLVLLDHDAVLAAAEDLCALSTTALHQLQDPMLKGQHLMADMALLRQERDRIVDGNDELHRQQIAERNRLKAAAKEEAQALADRLGVALAGKAEAIAMREAEAAAAAALLAQTVDQHDAENARLAADYAAERARSMAMLERCNAVAAARLDAATASATACSAILSSELWLSEAREEQLRAQCASLAHDADVRTRRWQHALGQRDAAVRALTAEVERLRGLCAAVGRPDASASDWRALHLESLKPPPQPLPLPPADDEDASAQLRTTLPSPPTPPPPEAPIVVDGVIASHDLIPTSSSAAPRVRRSRAGAAHARWGASAPSSSGRDSWTRLDRPWIAGRYGG